MSITFGVWDLFSSVTGRWNCAMTSCLCFGGQTAPEGQDCDTYLFSTHGPVESAVRDSLLFQRPRDNIEERGELGEDQCLVFGIEDFEVFDQLFHLGRSMLCHIRRLGWFDICLVRWQGQEGGERDGMSTEWADLVTMKPFVDTRQAV